MEPELKNKLIIASSIGLAIITAIFIKNKIQENIFKPLPKDKLLNILKKIHRQNYPVLKQVAAMASKIGEQMKLTQIDPDMIKQYLLSPDSPVKVYQMIDHNLTSILQTNGITRNDFMRSSEFYQKNQDKEIKAINEQFEKELELCLSGKIPQLKVNVPASLTKERIIEINKKIFLKKYLLNVDMFRKIRGISEAELVSNPSLLTGMPNPETEEDKVLEEEGLGNDEEPAAAVFYSAMAKYRNDTNFKQALQKIESNYKKIFEKYRLKLQQNKMTGNDLNELEDELTYSQV